MILRRSSPCAALGLLVGIRYLQQNICMTRLWGTPTRENFSLKLFLRRFNELRIAR
jgi:hypothetical protein